MGKTQAQRPPAHTTSGGPRAFMSAVQAANASAQSSRGHRRWGALLSLGLGSVDAKGLAMAARDGTASVDSVSVPAGGALSLAGGEDLPSAQHDNLFTKVWCSMVQHTPQSAAVLELGPLGGSQARPHTWF